MKNLSKQSFLILNVLIFMAALFYFAVSRVYTNIDSQIYSYLTLITCFMYGLVFYLIDVAKDGEEKNLRDARSFLIINTLATVFVILIWVWKPKDLFGLLMMPLFYVGNTYYWMVSHFGVVGPELEQLKFSNQLIAKIQKNMGLGIMGFAIILTIGYYFIPFIEKWGLTICSIFPALIPTLSQWFTVYITPKNKRYAEEPLE